MKIGAKIFPYNYALYHARKDFGMTQKQFSEYIGIPLHYYSKIETLKSFKNDPDLFINTLLAISDALNKDVSELFPKEYIYAVQERLLSKNQSTIEIVKDVDIGALPFSESLMLPSPEEMIEVNETKELMKLAVSELPPREATVIKLLYGLDKDEPLTMEQIARKIGITRERVRQIQNKAFRRLQLFVTEKDKNFASEENL